MKRFLFGLILVLIGFVAYPQAKSPSSVEDFTITITFAAPIEDPITVFKAPLKYNKDFALILQMDDGSETIYTQVLPFFKGQQGNPGLFFGDGAQGTVPFKMETAHFSYTGLGVDIHNYHQSWLNWDQMVTLWAGEFGITNHGFTDPPTADHEMEVRRNISYTRRQTSKTIIAGGADMNTYVIPGTNAAQIPTAKEHNLAVYHQGLSAIENPARVEDLPPIQGVEISRWSITNNLFQQVQAVANMSGPNNHYIATYFNHGFNPPDISFAAFQQQMNQIANAFGVNGTNQVWSTTSTEAFEYLRIRELVTVNVNELGNVVTISFTDNGVPDDFRFYGLTMVVEGESNIVNMDVQQPDGISTYSFGNNKALINMVWNGKAPVDLFERAENYVAAAEAQITAVNALVAMDYVLMLPEGEIKEELRERLCALPDMPYEDGFCKGPKFLGEDFDVCAGDTVSLQAPDGNNYLWSTGETTQSIQFEAVNNIEIWASFTDEQGEIYSDTVFITVNPLPIVAIQPEMAIVPPGEIVTLTAVGAPVWLWSTGSTTASINVSPEETTTYWAEGTSLAGCSRRAEATVQVVYTIQIDFTAYDVCLGDTTYLISQIISDDLVLSKEWDLNGDGVFEYVDNIESDTLMMVFTEAGEKLIGLRIKTQSGAIRIKYNQVIVADFPVAGFEFENTCLGDQTIFTDKSTVVVGDIQSRMWYFGDGNVSADNNPANQYEQPGTYEVQLIAYSVYGCTDTTRQNLTIGEPPLFTLRLNDGTTIQDNQQVPIAPNQTLVFEAIGTYDSVLWMDETPGFSYTITSGGDYRVTVYRDGCASTKYFTVVETVPPGPEPAVDIMNLLTPNGDGHNDIWLIKDLDALRPAKVVIYNRSGRVIYQSNDYQNDWGGTFNGNPAPEGTYFYIIEGKNGEVIKGPLSILR